MSNRHCCPCVVSRGRRKKKRRSWNSLSGHNIELFTSKKNAQQSNTRKGHSWHWPQVLLSLGQDGGVEGGHERPSHHQIANEWKRRR